MIWIIIGIILLVFLILFFSPIRIYVDYSDKRFHIILKYLFVNKKLMQDKQSNNIKKNKSKKGVKRHIKKNNENVKNTDKKNILLDGFLEKMVLIKNIFNSGRKSFRRITKHTKISDIYIDFLISDLDAYDCALKFGKANIIVYNILSYLGFFVKLKKKSINIKCIYNQPESVYNLKFKVSVTPAVAIITLAVFIFTFLVNNIKVKNIREKNYSS